MFPSDAMIVALVLATLLGVSIGTLACAQYVKWRLGKIWDGSPQGVLIQLVNDRAQNVNAVLSIHKELDTLHKSAGGMLQRLTDLKNEIDSSIAGLKPLLSELKVAANNSKLPDSTAAN